jgi:hypothetical protein
MKSLQETYSPDGICFGCGPTNEKGLRIRSFVEGDEVVAEFMAEPHHQAFSVRAQRRDHRCLARLPLELGGGVSFDEEARRR